MEKLTVFGRDVKLHLLERNLTQRDLAHKIGTSETFLSVSVK